MSLADGVTAAGMLTKEKSHIELTVGWFAHFVHVNPVILLLRDC